MCSIAGSKNPSTVWNMLEKMEHRSPDEMKVALNGPFSIGMGRLAIIDLKSKGLCPYFENNDAVTFNGEIYNFIELRKDLEKIGHKFRTTSDTEVLYKSYKQWGEKCLNKFNGMFAFAIYEPDKNKIFLARDIAGEKPLYYKEHPFQFASEAKALGFKCLELPLAHSLTYNLKTKQITIKNYWKPQLRKINLKRAVEELDFLLGDAIKIRTRADVPYGLYHSGGMDSALISSYHEFRYKFTYVDGDHRERFKNIFPKILWHLDYSTSHFSPFGYYQLGENAKRKVKVVITGDGADELFGGYVRYVQPNFNYYAQDHFPSYRRMFVPAEDVTQAGKREFYGNFQELLRIADRMSSAHGLENRSPFLDKRIIEFAFSLPHNFKIRGYETKWILRELLRRRLPKYKHIEKKGLFCSVNKWLGVKNPYDKKKYYEVQHKIINNNFRFR